MMKVVAIVQARMGSSRLTGKVFAEIVGRPAIWHLFEQLRYSQTLDSAVLATTNQEVDDRLAAYAVSQGWAVSRGDEQDVLDRYYQAAQSASCSGRDAIVRLTGDDILPDPTLLDELVSLYEAADPPVAHVSNNRTHGFPYGAYLEVFSSEALALAWRDAVSSEEREHVTPFIRRLVERFPWAELKPTEDNSDIHLSIDEPEDLEFNRGLFRLLYQHKSPPFLLGDVLHCVRHHELTRRRAAR